MNDFETWWHLEGSTPPLPGEDGEEHCKRMCKIAWSNGAFKEREACAKVCDDLAVDAYNNHDILYEECAAAIRNRSEV
jgi:hypothetical protein